MSSLAEFLYRLKLRHLLFLILLFSGIIPLAISSSLLIRQNTDILRTQEKSYLARSSSSLSQELDSFLVETHGRLDQLGESVLAAPVGETLRDKLRQDWIGERAARFLAANPEILAVRLMDSEGVGPQFASAALPADMLEPLEAAFRSATESGEVAFEFVGRSDQGTALIVIAVPAGPTGGERLISEALLEMTPMESFLRREAEGEVEA